MPSGRGADRRRVSYGRRPGGSGGRARIVVAGAHPSLQPDKMITVVGPQWELPDVLARSVQRFGLASEVRATGRPPSGQNARLRLSLIHISEPTRLGMISYAVFCLK